MVEQPEEIQMTSDARIRHLIATGYRFAVRGPYIILQRGSRKPQFMKQSDKEDPEAEAYNLLTAAKLAGPWKDEQNAHEFAVTLAKDLEEKYK